MIVPGGGKALVLAEYNEVPPTIHYNVEEEV